MEFQLRRTRTKMFKEIKECHTIVGPKKIYCAAKLETIESS